MGGYYVLHSALHGGIEVIKSEEEAMKAFQALCGQARIMIAASTRAASLTGNR
jgi:hypothetical protein